MERMLRKKKDNSEYEIDRELTGKFAIEKNVEYQEKIEQLEEENKNLKEENEQLHKDWNEFEGELRERIRELEDELWVWKHSYKKLMKDKKLYEKARAVMFGPEEEDLYEDVSCMEEDTLQELKDIGEI